MANTQPFRSGNWWYLETTNSNNDFILKRSPYQQKLDPTLMKTACTISANGIRRFIGLQIGFTGRVAIIILHSNIDFSYNLLVVDLETANILTIINRAGKDICLSADESWLYYLLLDNTGSPKELRKRSTTYPFDDTTVKNLHTEKWPTMAVTPSRRFIFLHEGNDTFVISTEDNTSNILQLCSQKVNGLKQIQDVEIRKHTYFIGYGNDESDRQYLVLIYDIKNLINFRNWEYIHVKIKGIINNLTIHNDEVILTVRIGGNEHVKWALLTDLINKQHDISWKEINLGQFSHHTAISLTQIYNPQNCQSMISICCPACKISSFEYLGKGIIDRHSTSNQHFFVSKRLNHHIKFFTVPSYDHVKVPVTLLYPQNSKATTSSNKAALVIVYGSYGKSLELSYDPSIQFLLDKGIYVVYAHVRGGGELGSQWHHAGQRANKQKAINDYIAISAAVKHKISEDDIPIIAAGASAGGSIAAAALNQRPNLYAAGLLVAPFISPIRAILDTQNPRSLIDQNEFGRLQSVYEIKALKRWSPLENVKTQLYPPICIAINEADTNVKKSDIYEYIKKLKETGCQVSISTRKQATHNYIPHIADISDELNWLLSFLNHK